jgi:hypothetical protein
MSYRSNEFSYKETNQNSNLFIESSSDDSDSEESYDQMMSNKKLDPVQQQRQTPQYLQQKPSLPQFQQQQQQRQLMTPNQSVVQQQQQTQNTRYDPTMKEAANTNWDYVQMIVACEYAPEELKKKGSSKKSKNQKKKMQLKDFSSVVNEGKLRLSVAKGTLILGRRSNRHDFEESFSSSSLSTLRGQQQSYSSQNTITSEGHRDLIKKVDVRNLTTTWQKDYSIGIVSIPLFKKEGYINNNNFVTETFAPGQTNAFNAMSCTMVDRTITKGVLQFYNMHTDTNPETIRSQINWTDRYAIVNKNSPIFMYFDLDAPENARYRDLKRDDLFSEYNQVTLPLDLANTLVETTQHEMKTKISYGDLSKCEVVIECIPSASRKKLHQQFVASEGKEGVEFKNFADFIHAKPYVNEQAINAETGLTELETFEKTPQRFNFHLWIDYLRLNGTLEYQ